MAYQGEMTGFQDSDLGAPFTGAWGSYVWLWEFESEVTSKHMKKSAKMIGAHHRTA
jgi:hypothetical protein